MAIQLDQKGTPSAVPTASRRGGSRPSRRDTRTARDSLVLMARQTLVQMRAGRRQARLGDPRRAR